MTNAIENARKALQAYNEPYLGDDPDGSYREDAHRLSEALCDLLDSFEYEYAIHSAKGEHLYPVDEQDRPLTAPTLWEVSEALGDRDPDYWDEDDVIVKRFVGNWEEVSS